MDESHLLDEHTFEQPRLLQRNERIIAVVSVSILCALVVCACYHGIHLSLLSLLLIALFLACVFINCILIGRVLMRIQERQLLSGQPEMFNEYVENLNNPVIHEKYASDSQPRFLGVKFPRIFGKRPVYV